MFTQPELAHLINNKYKDRLAILYDRPLRHRKISTEMSDTLWIVYLNVPARSIEGISMLFEDVSAQGAFARNNE